MKMRLDHLGACLLLGGVTLACAGGPGTVKVGEYQSRYEGLSVVGRSREDGEHGESGSASAGLMSRSWKLDNFFGSPTPVVAKSSDDYLITYRLDADGNGVHESSIERFLYELRFVNLNDDGVVWLRVVPVSSDLANTALPVLVDAYVDSMSGGSFDTVWVEPGRAKSRDKRYTAVLTGSQRCEIGGAECQLATIEVADIDQVKVSPDKRYRKLQVLIARTPFELRVRNRPFPTYLVAGYSNQPARFDANLPDFRDFVQRIVIRGGRGLTLVPAEAPAADRPAAASPAPTLPAPSPSGAPAAPSEDSAAPSAPAAE